ncbi:hypothetical protein JF116_10155 [Campylobacter fetus subsp. venerealis]|nr:hypothetical protein [Campylobacter fetus subsp. venerealis]
MTVVSGWWNDHVRVPLLMVVVNGSAVFTINSLGCKINNGGVCTWSFRLQEVTAKPPVNPALKKKKKKKY